MKDAKIIEILDEHFKLLANAAKNQCSGEELKAITEALIMTVRTYENIVFKHCDSSGNSFADDKSIENPIDRK